MLYQSKATITGKLKETADNNKDSSTRINFGNRLSKSFTSAFTNPDADNTDSTVTDTGVIETSSGETNTTNTGSTGVLNHVNTLRDITYHEEQLTEIAKKLRRPVPHSIVDMTAPSSAPTQAPAPNIFPKSSIANTSINSPTASNTPNLQQLVNSQQQSAPLQQQLTYQLRYLPTVYKIGYN
ncbi:hypothetical protein SARC_05926 [Sphaeroforma arctica JP610]|uniref:Uncharacterized protein n=1 Tax=Sphaeroforma arctica JP610 TaxID=667725 RepID=A0A0L0FY66_9EUKA|nr:hypothetical protein SARC_05926 [Sphaeroforma arctica JP610]KNC81780.1 hypothetical protein SARC_05926 [Sphaeroforma arctica JP610]|eukprot:XP_014155682.1 hypothetical protein SARC_05926 [Sphaeroforma arctica JP610]